jgi:microcin C transport system permease protein
VSGGISSLTALDYLGFGLPPPTPSWGELIAQGISSYSTSPWILASVVTAMVLVLVMIAFIGEGLRDAFDPKKYTVYK